MCQSIYKSPDTLNPRQWQLGIICFANDLIHQQGVIKLSSAARP